MSGISVGVTGGGWIAAEGFGRLRDGTIPTFGPGKAVVPARRGIFDRPLPRYGRFDDYTKLGCSAIALALHDAGLDGADEDRAIGIVSSSVWESLSVDLSYYETTLAEGGALASPNLFSYTLPGTVHGECAAYFRLTGPTICVGEDGGLGIAALTTALRLMATGSVSVMIAGWLDAPPAGLAVSDEALQAISGALFVVLEKDPRAQVSPVRRVRYRHGRVRLDTGAEIATLTDLFGSEASGS